MAEGFILSGESDRTITATIDSISVSIWRHHLLSHSGFELHTAVEDVEAITLQLSI
jgi:fatty-acid desaturase